MQWRTPSTKNKKLKKKPKPEEEEGSLNQQNKNPSRKNYLALFIEKNFCLLLSSRAKTREVYIHISYCYYCCFQLPINLPLIILYGDVIM
jgi:hypothetical protein